ncbi:hypothetical protein CBOM_00210 [Ceraceosorus bombacis]|uniref:Uncharacterized protein n=1 Tax=Ceraceosorus bombacis TaxID=401625 RepID=A0A0P1BAI9_9BASI|nr:hypothetical protein CBOM_00210 [Ceraceosorus bombacis]
MSTRSGPSSAGRPERSDSVSSSKEKPKLSRFRAALGHRDASVGSKLKASSSKPKKRILPRFNLPESTLCSGHMCADVTASLALQTDLATIRQRRMQARLKNGDATSESSSEVLQPPPPPRGADALSTEQSSPSSQAKRKDSKVRDLTLASMPASSHRAHATLGHIGNKTQEEVMSPPWGCIGLPSLPEAGEETPRVPSQGPSLEVQQPQAPKPLEVLPSSWSPLLNAFPIDTPNRRASLASDVPAQSCSDLSRQSMWDQESALDPDADLDRLISTYRHMSSRLTAGSNAEAWQSQAETAAPQEAHLTTPEPASCPAPSQARRLARSPSLNTLHSCGSGRAQAKTKQRGTNCEAVPEESNVDASGDDSSDALNKLGARAVDTFAEALHRAQSDACHGSHTVDDKLAARGSEGQHLRGKTRGDWIESLLERKELDADVSASPSSFSNPVRCRIAALTDSSATALATAPRVRSAATREPGHFGKHEHGQSLQDPAEVFVGTGAQLEQVRGSKDRMMAIFDHIERADGRLDPRKRLVSHRASRTAHDSCSIPRVATALASIPCSSQPSSPVSESSASLFSRDTAYYSRDTRPSSTSTQTSQPSISSAGAPDTPPTLKDARFFGAAHGTSVDSRPCATAPSSTGVSAWPAAFAQCNAAQDPCECDHGRAAVILHPNVYTNLGSASFDHLFVEPPRPAPLPPPISALRPARHRPRPKLGSGEQSGFFTPASGPRQNSAN